MGVEAAILASAAIGAGASAYTSDQQKKSSQRLANQSEQLARQERIRQSQMAKQKEEQLAAANNLARAATRRAENVQLQSKGIAPIGEAISQAVLNGGQ